MSDWMKQQSINDVQTAIQSQTIQTALERNNSALTDAAFQSFLTNAPIPRGYFTPSTNTTIPNNTETVLNFALADKTYDPFNILFQANTFRIPIDGFYTIQGSFNYLQPAGAGTYQHYGAIKSVSGTYGTAFIAITEGLGVLIGASSPSHIIPLVAVRPFRAGDTFDIVGFQVSSASETNTGAAYASFGIVWNAPYYQYTTQGGN